MQCNLKLAVGAALLTLAFAAPAQKPIAYPAKGQSSSQQSKDDGECQKWAQQNTEPSASIPWPITLQPQWPQTGASAWIAHSKLSKA